MPGLPRRTALPAGQCRALVNISCRCDRCYSRQKPPRSLLLEAKEPWKVSGHSVADAPPRPHTAESPDGLPAGGRPARADCLLHNPSLSEAPLRAVTSLALGSWHPITRVYVIGEARPSRRMLDEGQATASAIPRPPSRLISAPLQMVAAETASTILREPRGNEKTRRPPFPGSNDLAALLAVKGSLRRSVPLTAAGRREKDHLI
jgi:hypothetical protein